MTAKQLAGGFLLFVIFWILMSLCLIAGSLP